MTTFTPKPITATAAQKTREMTKAIVTSTCPTLPWLSCANLTPQQQPRGATPGDPVGSSPGGRNSPF
eukprot:CAMPEP_0115562826 /NCGR_PEP_ID=MMETSP0271-20121206/101718_1 /TAXON_ID=71861 /ORGANISM="Scrippsiella trochoidea, Strain CCMP3099" /LENGTH=66 /DNA_ID=CAMNT_0002997013 /DNA_START=99 /DNA_END=297 /DNA_ORIENTATION=-